jgi:hypothetical protein
MQKISQITVSCFLSARLTSARADSWGFAPARLLFLQKSQCPVASSFKR